MKLTEDVRNKLAYLSTIYESILIRPGSILRARNEGRNCLAKVTINESFPEQFVIYKIKEFLKVSALLNEPEMVFHKVSDDVDSGVYVELIEGNAIVRYKFSFQSLHKNIPDDADYIPKDVQWTAKISLDETEIANIFNVARVMNLDLLSFTRDSIKMGLSKDKDMVHFEIKYQNELEVSGDAPEEFNVKFAVDNLKLMKGSYNLQILGGTHTVAKFDKVEGDNTVWAVPLRGV